MVGIPLLLDNVCEQKQKHNDKVINKRTNDKANIKKQLAVASQTKGEIKIDMVRRLIRKRGSTVRDYRSACCMEVMMKRLNFKQVGLGFEPGLGLGPEVCDNERRRVKIEWFG